MPTSHYIVITIVGAILVVVFAINYWILEAKRKAQERTDILLWDLRNKIHSQELMAEARRAEQARQEEIRQALHFRASSLPPRRHALPKGRRLPI